jgi:serine/threonine protein kinase
MEDKKKKEQQDFIVETPMVIEERLTKTGDKVKKYERGKFLGKGGFAKCYEMKCVETGKIYAAKVFEKKALSNARSRKKLVNEIKLHKKLHHQNIVNFEHFFEDKENVYILLELCSNQTLNDFLKRRKRLSEIEVQCFLMQIIKALKYIHSHKIIHRDLKLGNLFLTSKLELKLGDFGLAAKLEFDGQRRRTVCGTPNYIAPEILEKKNGHSFEVDIWSLGVVAYTLLFGRPPFETNDVKLTYKKIKMNNYTFPEGLKVHPSAKKFISAILNLDPSKRPTLDAILEHEFFRIYNSVPVMLPLSTLACPPSNRYIAGFMRGDAGNYLLNSSMQFSNTFSNFHLKFKSNGDLNNEFIINEEDENGSNLHHDRGALSHRNNFHNLSNQPSLLNNHMSINPMTMTSLDGINLNDQVNKEILNRLLNSADHTLHRKSESLNNFHDEKFLDKVHQIMNGNLGSNNNLNNGVPSRNFATINNGTSNGLPNNIENIGSIDVYSNHNLTQNLQNLQGIQNNNLPSQNSTNQNIINNNFYINFASLNNMELKVDESVLKKLEDVTLNRGGVNNNLINSNNMKKISYDFNKISKFYDYANKFGIVYFVNNTHIAICFNDNSNILKNVSLGQKNSSSLHNNKQEIGNKSHHLHLEKKGSESRFSTFINNKNFHYVYIDKDGNPQNYDEITFENLVSSHSVSKEMNKKFEIFKHILTKYTPEILTLQDPHKNSNAMFYVKKFIKVQHASLFRLSNKLIQVCFVDKTELIMSTESSDFYFRNKNGEELLESIQSIMNSDNTELIKRIKYSKNLLIHFVKNQKNKKTTK